MNFPCKPHDLVECQSSEEVRNSCYENVTDESKRIDDFSVKLQPKSAGTVARPSVSYVVEKPLWTLQVQKMSTPCKPITPITGNAILTEIESAWTQHKSSSANRVLQSPSLEANGKNIISSQQVSDEQSIQTVETLSSPVSVQVVGECGEEDECNFVLAALGSDKTKEMGKEDTKEASAHTASLYEYTTVYELIGFIRNGTCSISSLYRKGFSLKYKISGEGQIFHTCQPTSSDGVDCKPLLPLASDPSFPFVSASLPANNQKDILPGENTVLKVPVVSALTIVTPDLSPPLRIIPSSVTQIGAGQELDALVISGCSQSPRGHRAMRSKPLAGVKHSKVQYRFPSSLPAEDDLANLMTRFHFKRLSRTSPVRHSLSVDETTEQLISKVRAHAEAARAASPIHHALANSSVAPHIRDQVQQLTASSGSSPQSRFSTRLAPFTSRENTPPRMQSSYVTKSWNNAPPPAPTSDLRLVPPQWLNHEAQHHSISNTSLRKAQSESPSALENALQSVPVLNGQNASSLPPSLTKHMADLIIKHAAQRSETPSFNASTSKAASRGGHSPRMSMEAYQKLPMPGASHFRPTIWGSMSSVSMSSLLGMSAETCKSASKLSRVGGSSTHIVRLPQIPPRTPAS